METAFGWLGRIMEFIGAFFPRLVIVKSTHGGVAFVRGRNPRLIRPGLIFYWPLWTEVILYPIVRQSLNLPSQTVTTKDGKTITISTVIVYEVADILKALTVQWDLNETLRDISMAAVREYAQGASFAELRGKETLALRDTIKKRVTPYGIRTLNAWVTDLAQTKVITLVTPNGSGAAAIAPYSEEE